MTPRNVTFKLASLQENVSIFPDGHKYKTNFNGFDTGSYQASIIPLDVGGVAGGGGHNRSGHYLIFYFFLFAL